MSWEGTAVISLVVLENSMDLPNREAGSTNETLVTSEHDGNEVFGIEDETLYDISEDSDHKTTTISAVKTELILGFVPRVCVQHIF